VSSPLPRWSLFAAAGVVLWVGRAGAQDQIIKPTTISATDRLPPPATVKAAQQPDGRIRVVWNAVEGASKYTLTRSVPNVGMGVISRPNPSDTMYLDSDVTKGAYYYYLVNAVGANGMTGLKIGAAPVLATISVTAAPDTSPTGGTGATGSGSTGGDTASAASETRAQMLQRAYNEGGKRFPNYKAASQTRWLALADKSGMSYDQLVAAWDGIFVVDYAYENLLQRQPTGDEVKKYASAAAGTTGRASGGKLRRRPNETRSSGTTLPPHSPTLVRRPPNSGSSRPLILNSASAESGTNARAEFRWPTQRFSPDGSSTSLFRTALRWGSWKLELRWEASCTTTPVWPTEAG
jgi:hypothetical protein